MDSYLGTPTRVIYESRYFTGNLTGIYARITKPNNVIVGNFGLNAFADPYLVGVYYFDFLTSTSDPEGTYTGIVISPSEQIKTTFRLSILQRPEGSSGGASMLVSDQIEVVLENPSVTVELKDVEPIVVQVEEKNVLVIEESED